MPDHELSRRNLMTGLGVTAGVAALGALPGAAFAREASPSSAEAAAGSPIASTLASSPQPGVSYRHVSWADFSTEDGSARVFSSNGVNTSTLTSLWASVEVPTGARLFDIEWFVYNASGANVGLMGRLWRANGALANVAVADGLVGSDFGVRAVRVVAPGATNGPYPTGTKLLLGISSNGPTIAVNGARIGFLPGALQTVLLPTPIRVFDSRTSGGKLEPNTFRDVSIASAVPVGTVGAVVNLSITDSIGAGSMRVGAGGVAPTATAVQWYQTGARLTGSTHTAVSGSRSIRIAPYAASGRTHVIVDLVGYLV